MIVREGSRRPVLLVKTQPTALFQPSYNNSHLIMSIAGFSITLVFLGLMLSLWRADHNFEACLLVSLQDHQQIGKKFEEKKYALERQTREPIGLMNLIILQSATVKYFVLLIMNNI